MMTVAKYRKQRMRALMVAKYRKQWMRALAADEVEKEEEVASEYDLAVEVGELESAQMDAAVFARLVVGCLLVKSPVQRQLPK
jgi:hypothetical protein